MAKNYAIAVTLAAIISLMSTICFAQEHVNVGGALIPVTAPEMEARTDTVTTVLDEGDDKCTHIIISTGPLYSLAANGVWGMATFDACRKCTRVVEHRPVTTYTPKAAPVLTLFDVRVSSAAKKPKPATIQAVLEEVR